MNIFQHISVEYFKFLQHVWVHLVRKWNKCLRSGYISWPLLHVEEQAVSRAHTASDSSRQLQWELFLIWDPETHPRNALNWGRESYLRVKLSWDFLTYNFCLEWLRLNSSLMTTSFLLWVVVKPSFMDAQKFLESFAMEAILWIYQCMYICLMRGHMQFCRILWNESKKR